MILNEFVSQLLSGVDKKYALNYIFKNDYNKYHSDYCINLYNRILNEDISKIYKANINFTDNIVDILKASLWNFLNSRNFENAIKLGDNTNMIDDITKLWCVIVFCNQQFSKKWYKKLNGKDILNNLYISFNKLIDVNNKIEECNLLCFIGGDYVMTEEEKRIVAENALNESEFYIAFLDQILNNDKISKEKKGKFLEKKIRLEKSVENLRNVLNNYDSKKSR